MGCSLTSPCPCYCMIRRWPSWVCLSVEGAETKIEIPNSDPQKMRSGSVFPKFETNPAGASLRVPRSRIVSRLRGEICASVACHAGHLGALGLLPLQSSCLEKTPQAVLAELQALCKHIREPNPPGLDFSACFQGAVVLDAYAFVHHTIYIHAYIHTRKYAYRYITYIHTCAYIYIYMYTYIIYIHTYVHTCTYTLCICRLSSILDSTS